MKDIILKPNLNNKALIAAKIIPFKIPIVNSFTTFDENYF